MAEAGAKLVISLELSNTIFNRHKETIKGFEDVVFPIQCDIAYLPITVKPDILYCINVLQHTKDPKKTFNNLSRLMHKENIFLSKQLATILTDIDIKFDMNKAKFNGYSRNLEEFFLTYEITSLLKRMFPKAKSESITTVEKKQKKDDDQIGLF